MRGMALLVIASPAALSIPVWAAGAPAPGVPNFHQVNERIYRGAQPNGEGWDSLAKLGVKTVIDLRPESEHSIPVWAAGAPAPGVPNFHQVNERIYRGAQPNGEGWDSLAKLGVKTVIDLRPESEHSCKAEKGAVEAAGMHYVNL